MIISTKALSLALALAIAGGSSVSEASSAVDGLPPHHPPMRGQAAVPMHPTLARFSSQFRCPYAKEWLSKGAHRAAIDLGLTTPEKIEASKKNAHYYAHEGQRKRVLQEAASSAASMGSCTFSNQWTGPSCLEFRGEGWTEDAMDERCGSEPESTVAMRGEGCPRPTELAGWCLKEASADNTFEATSMMISAMSDCDGNKMACATFMGGAFEAAEGCGGGALPADMMGGGGIPSDYANMGPPSTKCIIAPGAIGAAHQAAFSEGYSKTCPGTPSEGSPYMWPMAWSADIDTQSMAFGYDDIVHQNKGRTFYRLDKNWKRSDTVYSKGVRRGVGQGPCDDIDEAQSEEGIIACKTDLDVASGDPMETMIHRGSKMYFITWKNSTDVVVGEKDPSLIAECNYMDLVVIGNIRPDWFLDDRGDDTDVQYLGDQHVYYSSSIPRLVKQWRKKDFASQYFTMSVAGNPPSQNTTTTDSPHWPLILNIPGEGFGDDMLQVYHNHSLLTDEDDDLFDLVQNLESSGGSCPLLTSGMGPVGTEGGATIGPPVTEVHVPSNLEVDENSWFTSVYTFSPVLQPPMTTKPKEYGASSSMAMTMAVTEAGRVSVESCYDPSSKSVTLSVEFKDIETIPTEAGLRLPWMALGYRNDEVCSMTPIGGGDSKIIMVSQSSNEDIPKAYAGSMGPNTKRFDQDAIGSIYGSFWPLGETVGYSNVALNTLIMMGDGGTASSAEVSRSSTPNTLSSSSNSVILSFKQEFDQKPEVMHLMYSIGMSPTLGVHTARSCFEIVEFPTCGDSTDFASLPEKSVAPPNVDGISINSESSSSSSSSAASPAPKAVFLGIATVTALVGSLFLAF